MYVDSYSKYGYFPVCRVFPTYWPQTYLYPILSPFSSELAYRSQWLKGNQGAGRAHLLLLPGHKRVVNCRPRVNTVDNAKVKSLLSNLRSMRMCMWAIHLKELWLLESNFIFLLKVPKYPHPSFLVATRVNENARLNKTWEIYRDWTHLIKGPIPPRACNSQLLKIRLSWSIMISRSTKRPREIAWLRSENGQIVSKMVLQTALGTAPWFWQWSYIDVSDCKFKAFWRSSRLLWRTYFFNSVELFSAQTDFAYIKRFKSLTSLVCVSSSSYRHKFKEQICTHYSAGSLPVSTTVQLAHVTCHHAESLESSRGSISKGTQLHLILSHKDCPSLSKEFGGVLKRY